MDDLEIRKKRALYRAHHRGTKELDFMLGRFAEARLSLMPEDELSRFEELLAMQDPDIDQFLRGGGEAPAPVAPMAAKIRGFFQT